MKSIIVVFGAFLFTIFTEGFFRVIIIFYHKSEFALFGMASLPSYNWIAIIFAALIVIYWLAAMVVITIVPSATVKHLLSFGALLLLWRVNEMVQTSFAEPFWYYILVFILIPVSLSVAYLTQKKANASISS